MDHLYVCHFDGGHIKVGRSTDPQSRIASHAQRVSCVGIEIIEGRVFPCIAEAVAPETALIKRCRETAEKNHVGEWFLGLDFELVCKWAHEFANSIFVSPAQRTKCQFTPQQRAELASRTGVGEAYLYQCLTGRRDMNPAEAYRVERETGGLVTRTMLCQSTWLGIWPEIAQATVEV